MLRINISVKVILAPSDALNGWTEFFFVRRDDGLVAEGQEVPLAFKCGQR
jgi:hypothetical protein